MKNSVALGSALPGRTNSMLGRGGDMAGEHCARLCSRETGHAAEGTCIMAGKQGHSGDVRGASDQLLLVRGPAEYGGV